MRSHDWHSSTLGDPDGWPQGLKTVVQLMLNTGHPMYIWWGTELLCFYNDAYSQSIGPERHPGSLGRAAAEVWQEIWPIIGPQIDQVMSGRGATWHENSLVPMTRNGRCEDVYWTYSYSPIHDPAAANGIGGVLVVCTETTEEVLAKRALASAAQRQQRMFEAAPGFITVLRGPDHIFEFVNTAYKEMFGARDFIGRPVRDAFPEIGGQGFLELLDQVYATGERLTPEAMPILLRNNPDGPPEEHFITFVYAPIFASDGAVIGIFCEGMDVTTQRAAEEHRRLLTHELQHRVKNMLSIVQGIVTQSLRNVATPAEARDAITSRLITLAHAHDILTQSSWTEAPLGALVEGAVLLHCLDRDRVRVDGPAIKLRSRSALALSMALHELFTNALKYGALANDAGTIAITWAVKEGANEPIFEMAWTESGGPLVMPPSRTGFGLRLTGAGLATALGSSGVTTYPPEGLRWILTTKLGAVCVEAS
nr:HWE histidine kinase domain-containing protein [Polymorphobacter sp.]